MGNEKLNNGVIDLEGEVWKVINHPSIGDYSNYEISNFGRVKSRRGDKEKLLKVQKNKKTDYFQVCLCINGVKRMFRLNRLVALMFIPNPDNLPCVNHIDEDKNNNCVSNLEWCTQQYNLTYGTRIERIIKKLKETLKTSIAFKEGRERWKKTIQNSTAWKEGVKKRSKTVYQYDQNLNLLKIYESLKDASLETGFDFRNISACCNGRQKTTGGYIFSYFPLPNSTNQLTLFPTITKVS